MFNLALGESGVNARGIGGFPLKSEFAKETEKERRDGRDAPLVMIRGLTKRALQPRWSNGVTFGIITTEDEEGSKSSVADVVLVWRSGRDSLFISRLFNRNLNS